MAQNVISYKGHYPERSVQCEIGEYAHGPCNLSSALERARVEENLK